MLRFRRYQGMRRAACVLLALAALAPGSTGPAAAAPAGAPGCRLFPANNIWHADISSLPVHPRSAAWLDSMDAATSRLHPDFGPSGLSRPYGIPFTVVDGDHAKRIVRFEYADESDPGPYPVGADTKIEMGSDRHALIVDRDACKLYELFALRKVDGRWHAGSGAIWDLGSNALRPAGWTSADAAGLPILPGLVRREEVAAGAIYHAIRFTASRTSRRYLWPARHQAGSTDDPDVPPMGARFRLKASYDISGFRADTRVILRAMKRYGLILADNGSDWFFTGASQEGWNTDMLDELKSVPASRFVAVDTSSLRVYPNSGLARRP